MGARRKIIAEYFIVIALLSLRSVLEVESSNAYCNFVIILLPKLWLIGLVFQNELSDSPPFLLDEKVYYTNAFFPSR